LTRLTEHISPLKEGEKIKMKLNIKSKKNQELEDQQQQQDFMSDSGFSSFKPVPVMGLKPPPSAPASAVQNTVFNGMSPSVPTATATSTATNNNDDEWGDFESG
jgi:hypothetical protein